MVCKEQQKGIGLVFASEFMAENEPVTSDFLKLLTGAISGCWKLRRFMEKR